MREKINGIIYDTQKSKKLASNGYRSTYYSYSTLYMTQEGDFFVHFQSYYPKDGCGFEEHEYLGTVSIEEAQEFIISTLDCEECTCDGNIDDNFLNGLLIKFEESLKNGRITL